GIDFAGRALNRSPKWSWVAGVNYAIPVGEGKVVLDAQTSSRSQYELTDLANFAYFAQPGFSKSDASITYNAPEDRFYIAAFVENIEDNLVLTGAGTGLFGNATFSDPRTYGVRAGVKF
ncbi:MAG: TonB-dependent receptor, partial [Pseudomonadota bacterium]